MKITLDQLKRADRLAELLASPAMVDRDVRARLHQSERHAQPRQPLPSPNGVSQTSQTVWKRSGEWHVTVSDPGERSPFPGAA